MQIRPLSALSQSKPIQKYMGWSSIKTVKNGETVTNYSKVQKIFPKCFMVWLAAIQCYFLAKSQEMPKERKIPLIFNNIYSCTIALTAGALLGKRMNKLTGKMVERAQKIYEQNTHKESLINGIKTGVPFLTEAVLFQYVGPVIATPLAVSTTSYLAKKGKIKLADNNGIAKNRN